MDWNAATAGYVIAAYAISGLSITALIIWCVARDRAASHAVQKLKD